MSEVVDEPGLYADIPESVYHGDRGSLSSSGARKLLPPSCPAIFQHERNNPPETKPYFELGTAAHSLVLGVGAPIVEIPDELLASNGAATTKAAKEFVAEHRAAGAVPLKTDEYATVHAMAAKLREHPIASALLRGGRSEVSAYWVDEPTGVWRRCRFDYLPEPVRGRRLIIPDYKTTQDSNPAKFGKSAADFGYYMQAPWYLDAIAALGIADDAAFVFVVQSKTPPYLVSVVELDYAAIELGYLMNRRAIDIYAECESTGEWPGYGDDIHHIALPKWIHIQNEEYLNRV